MNKISETQQKIVTINNGLPTDPQPVIDKPIKKSRIPLIIISLIIILLLCGGVIVIYKNRIITNEKPISPSPTLTQPTTTPTPTTDSLSDWKTYTDMKDNYSFKYPGDWKLFIEQSLPPIYNLSYLNKTDNKNWVIEIRLIPQDRLSLMGVTYCGAYPEDKSRCEYMILNNINVLIDWGIKVNNENTAVVSIPYVNKGVIDITLTPVNPETKKILYQILSTFKFLDQLTLTINSTTDWKTYINQKYGFSFKYPGSLYIRSDSTDNFIGFLLNQNENRSQKLIVQVMNNPSNLSIENYAEQNKPIPDDRINTNYTKTESNNYEGLILRYEKPCLGVCEKVKIEKHFVKYLKGDKHIVGFSVETTNPAGNTLEDEQWLDQILSTFHFLDQSTSTNPQSLCESTAGGKWLANYNECEGISSKQCSQLLNGTYDNCTSACRHDPKAEICTGNCVPVCAVNTNPSITR